LYIDEKALDKATEAAKLIRDTPEGIVRTAIETYLTHAPEYCPYDCDGCHAHCWDYKNWTDEYGPCPEHRDNGN
jgi:hypothetical protein